MESKEGHSHGASCNQRCPIPSFSPNKEPNILLVGGGENFHGMSGKVKRNVDEYDIVNDLYCCLEPLPWATFGGVLGTHEGKLHVVFGAEWIGLTAKASHPFHYALDTSKEDGQWERKADMPAPRGGHGCGFMADGRMYCVGGGSSQNGPYKNEMIIYDPATDTWEVGPSMTTPKDHVMESVIAIRGGKQLYVPGGRSHTTEVDPNVAHPYHFSTSNIVEIYDLETNTWSRKKDILMERAAISVVPYHRFGPNEEPNILLVGGEQFHGWSGKVERTVDEYDVVNDLYYCLEPLPWPTFGGALGTHEGKLHVVSGAEWIGLTATRRVQLYDLKHSPPLRECFYDPIPVFDQWDRLWNKVRPYPELRQNFDLEESEERRNLKRAPLPHYDYLVV
eukprot:CAMPEP_0203685150 /NCGR_PEP_ID=MMETSP0090-20130426/48402_1 /ASSEMBLY_ACC=CAM_ASM_001088 /TAXON_ID=426623 /ORGANISM="Chaetoceros affinis, Strain CCMP159" /LENGTH=391 /DNA_ID=CAMNT_0050554337 /DNA_START=120 /DNA_END=1295 /DNA_ORIENTATION=-